MLTKEKRLKLERKKIKANEKRYNRNFDRFGNPVFIGPMILNSYQRAILRGSLFTDEQMNFMNALFN